MELYTANETEWEKVRDFYWQLIDSMDSALYKPGWKKGIYPSDELLMRSIRGERIVCTSLRQHLCGCNDLKS